MFFWHVLFPNVNLCKFIYTHTFSCTCLHHLNFYSDKQGYCCQDCSIEINEQTLKKPSKSYAKCNQYFRKISKVFAKSKWHVICM